MWDDDEAVLEIPVTDAGTVLTLTEADAVATTLTVGELRAAFRAEGLLLLLDVEGDDELEDAEDIEEALGAADAELSDPEQDLIDENLFAPHPVQIAVFSHRGPFAGRMLAQLNRVAVDHMESGAWSLVRFASEESTTAGIGSAAEMPVIELNRVAGGGDWFEITTPGGLHLFWPDAQRATEPVLDLDAITVPETQAICRALLSDGDGSREELIELAAHSVLDVDAAHRALRPEALGGIVGLRAREEAFLAAFGLPAELIAGAFEEPHLPVRRFERTGWARAIGDTLVGGLGEMTPLTRRDRPFARLGAALRSKPLIAAALSVAELSGGILLSRRAGAGRFFGILLISDAIGDLIIAEVRRRRR
ncbi:hypothetical protein [Microbacterium sp. GXF6406]